MAEGVIFTRSDAGKAKAEKRGDRRGGIRKIVKSVCSDGGGAA